jgi:hypothetical protein
MAEAPPPGGYGAPPGGYGAPPGGYGAPPGGYGPPPNYGAPPAPIPYGMPPPSPYALPTKGSVGLGFLAGFFGACLGLALVFALAKGPDTKKGAAIGFGVFIALSVISNIITYALR